MARPTKHEDNLIHRIADLFKYADVYNDGYVDGEELKQDEPVWIHLADKRVLMNGVQDVHWAISNLLCDLKPEVRPSVLRRVADALEGKSAKKRKSGKADDIAKIREAWRRAKAKLKGLYKGDNPTRREVEKIYGEHLDRRSLKNADCPIRPDKRGRRKQLPRR